MGKLDKQLERFYLSEGTLRLYAKHKNIKYKKAVDEIENIIKDYCENMCMSETKETCESCQNTEIRNVINKLKEQTK